MNKGDLLYKIVKNKIVFSEIDEIGRKTILIDNKKVNKNTLYYINKNYPQNNIQYYKTEQDAFDVIEKNNLCNYLCDKLQYYNIKNYSLEQLKKMLQIIEE